MYGGAIHNKDFMTLILKHIQESNAQVYSTFDRMNGMLNVISDVLPNAPLYYSMSSLSNVLHCQTPPLEMIKSALLNAGYDLSETHCCAGALKTNAPIKVFWDIFLQYCQVHFPLNPDKLSPKSPAWAIYHAEPRFLFIFQQYFNWSSAKMDFTKHPNAISKSKKVKLVRYQANPTPFWGPKSKPKKRKAALDVEE